MIIIRFDSLYQRKLWWRYLGIFFLISAAEVGIWQDTGFTIFPEERVLFPFIMMYWIFFGRITLKICGVAENAEYDRKVRKKVYEFENSPIGIRYRKIELIFGAILIATLIGIFVWAILNV